MLGERYQTLAVHVQQRYVRSTLSDTSSRLQQCMLGACYQTLAVEMQHSYVRCTLSDTSSRYAAPVCQVHAIGLYQQICRTGILGAGSQTLVVELQQGMLFARYRTLAVDVQHRYVRCTQEDTSSICAAILY